MGDTLPREDREMALRTELEPIVRRRFTVEEYHRMGTAGILGETERVELIHGDIVQMTPIGPDHASVVARIANLLKDVLRERVIVWSQNPVSLKDEASEPQPDVVLLRPKPDFYRSGHPEPPDVLLLVEVMVSSAAFDRQVKLPLYARASIVEVWLVDLNASTVEVHRDPSPTGYRGRRVVDRDATVGPLAFPEVTLRGRDLTG